MDRIQRDLELAGLRERLGWIRGEGASSSQDPSLSLCVQRQIKPAWQPDANRKPSGDQARQRIGPWWPDVGAA